MLNIILSILFLYLPFQVALNPIEGIDLASVRLIIPFIFLIWLLQGFKNKKIIISYNKTTLLILSFLFLSGFSLIMAMNIEWGIRKLLFLLSFFPLYFIVVTRKYAEAIFILKFLVWGAFLSAIIGIFQFFLQFIFGINKAIYIWSEVIIPFLGNSFSEAILENSSWLVNAGGHTLLRAIAFFPDPHMFSFYLGMSAPIALALYLKVKKNGNLYLISFFIILLANFLTFSRGGYLGIIIGLLFFGLLFFQKKYFQFKLNLPLKKNIYYNKYFFLSFLTIAFTIIIMTTANPIINRLYSSFDLTEGSNSERIEIWKKSLEVINKNPVLGVGLGNYALSIKPSAEYREPIYSHNLYMDIAVETGVFNAIIFISFLFFSISNLIKNLNKKNNIIYLGLASSLIVFTVHSIFETALFSVHILPLFILIIGLSNIKC